MDEPRSERSATIPHSVRTSNIPLNIYKEGEGVTSSWWAASRGIVKRPVIFNSTYRFITELLKPRQRRTPDFVNSFEAQSISAPLPPSDSCPEGELTIGEVYQEMISMKSAQDRDRSIDKYIEAGGVVYPHVIVPDVDYSIRVSYVKNASGWWSRWPSLTEEHTRYGSPTSKPQQRPQLPLYDALLSAFKINIFSTVPETLKIPMDARISSFAWDKNLGRFSVSLKNDQIYTYDIISDSWSRMSLSHEYQNDISCSEYRPNSGPMIAVGCRHGVCFWGVNRVKKPKEDGKRSCPFEDSSATMKYFLYPKFEPITTLSWSPCGRYLAVGSPNSTNVLIWNVNSGTNTLLQPGITGGVTIIKWSPNGNYLFAGGIGGTVRCWETLTWRQQGWSQFSDVCQAACWSGDSSFLALSFANESLIHFIHFPHSPPAIDAVHVLTSHLNRYKYQDKFDVCGNIKEIAWDMTSSRLVLSFQDTPLMAVFSTFVRPTLGVHPLGFIRGPAMGGLPRLIQFSPHFKRGALLTAVWENGKISFFPFYFKEYSEENVEQ